MSSKSRFFAVLALFFAGTVVIAAPRAAYRIVLRDGSTVLSSDRPRIMGSVVVFRKYPGRTLTGLPAEEVAELRSGVARTASAATPAPAAPLQPGEVVVIGTTAPGGPAPAPADASVVARRPAIPGGVYDPRNPAFGYGGGGPNTAATQILTPSGVTTLPTPGDTARAISGEPPNLEQPIGPNGFPTTATTTPQIGPDGQPILAPAGTPGSTQPVIGPNGTPVLAPSGAPGSTPPTTGPNGFPASKAPGSK